jgi:lipoprotein-releasing system permease protein
MAGGFERMVAMRYLRPTRQEGLISISALISFLGIAFGVATLIVVMSVMNGFREDILSRVLGIDAHINIRGPKGRLDDHDALIRKIHLVEGVVSAVPLIDGQVMASHGGRVTGAEVRGIRPPDLALRPIIADNIVDGSLEQFRAGRGVIVGSRLASHLGLRVGDRISLISPRRRGDGKSLVPLMRAFPISAVFAIGMYEYDSSFVFMPLGMASRYFDLADSVTALEVMTDDPNRVGLIAPAIADIIGGAGKVESWQDAKASLFNALQVERVVMFLILSLIIIIAAFNIVSSLIMMVKRKGRDVAILRTMGATQGMVMRLFIITGASVGIVGTAAGLGLALLFIDNMESVRAWFFWLSRFDLFQSMASFLARLPVRMEVTEVITVVAMGFVLSVLATIYPSWRAARLDPAEALRHE